jgi:lipopolysaccharide biosynthesis glycosyltransferase
MTSEGIIYYGTGEYYLQEAIRSAKSVKEYNKIHITIYTDQSAVQNNCFDSVRQIKSSQFPFYDRINYFKQTPYKKTIHLDTDTIITGNIESIFELLDRFDIVAAINESRDTASEHHKFETVDIAPDSFPEYQCGVIGFCDTEQVESLLDDWQSRYLPYRNKNILDQPFFRESLYNNDIKLGTLPSEYNALLYFGGYFEQKVKIIHLAGTKPKEFPLSFIKYRSIGELIREINQPAPHKPVPTKRVLFYDYLNRLQVRNVAEPRSIIPRIIQSINYNGVRGTISIALNKLYDSVENKMQYKNEK